MPLQRIAELCHAYGAELAIDAVQALGAMPIDVRALGVDYLAAGSHKWLLGLDGAGVLFARRELAARLRPGIVGAMSHVDASAIFVGANQLRYDRPLRSDVRVFEGGMMSSVSLAALSASLDLLLPLGAANIHAHVNAYLDRLEPALTARGFSSLRMADEARRSCILGLRPPTGVDAATLAGKLLAQGVIGASPDGVLRFAPHFYNALDEVPKVIAALDAALA
jgi:selenocysteine lyase/cysteine desulfurase